MGYWDHMLTLERKRMDDALERHPSSRRAPDPIPKDDYTDPPLPEWMPR